MRWLIAGTFVFSIYAAICFYIGIRLFVFIGHFLPGMKAAVFWLFYALLCCVLVSVNFTPFNLGFLRKAGSLWMAVFFYMFMLLALSDIIRLVFFLFGKHINNLQIYTVGFSIIFCAVLIVFGALHARSIKTVNYDLTLSGGSGDNIRIALVSDLHIGHSIGGSHIKKLADKINAAEPDIVFIAGDVFDGNLEVINDIDSVISGLKMIKAPLGVYACLGNHDVDRFSVGKTDRIENILKSSDVVLLQDEVFKLLDNLYIAGRRDASPIGMSAERKTARDLCAGIEGTIIMLDHQPTEFAQNEQAGVDLLLCGHTHRGQLFPATLITRKIFQKAGATHYGYWRGETMQAIVTSGAGYWGPPVRIGTNSEVAVIDVKFVQ